jgi:hypothetical protein
MKIHVFAVRYREDIKPFLDNYYTFDDESIKLTIINNHGVLEREHYQEYNYEIINNSLRPDFSTGHLARNWNQAIINGFQNLNNPSVDYVVCVQIDSILSKDWHKNLISLLTQNPSLEYACLGMGDEFQVFTPAIVKKVGLYDERYCNIGYQEADYFLRVLNRSPETALINDVHHGRIINGLKISSEQFANIVVYEDYKVTNDDHYKSMAHHSVSLGIFRYKWGNVRPEHWINTDVDTTCKEFRYYPYFEKDINSEIYIV